MTRFERENLKVRILKLASLKSTGTPVDLATKFSISVRTVKRIIREIREAGYEIWFCKARGTYVIGIDYS